jgi:hypothetical protein
VILAQAVKRGLIGWGPSGEFDFGNRFVDPLVANLLYGSPVLLLYLVLLAFLNRKKTTAE